MKPTMQQIFAQIAKQQRADRRVTRFGRRAVSVDQAQRIGARRRDMKEAAGDLFLLVAAPLAFGFAITSLI